MLFSWDKQKAASNAKEHGIAFDETSEIFEDPLHISVLDVRFDYYEERWITMGMTKGGRLLVAGHLYSMESDGKEHIRIITAREATKKEHARYESIG